MLQEIATIAFDVHYHSHILKTTEAFENHSKPQSHTDTDFPNLLASEGRMCLLDCPQLSLHYLHYACAQGQFHLGPRPCKV